MDRTNGRGGGIVAFARAEWRAHWRSHLLIAALAATTAAVLLATFLAAERSRTAFDRLREATHASDIRIQITGGSPLAALEEVRRHPDAIDARAASQLWVRPVGSDLFPTFTLLAIAPRVDDPSASVDTPIYTAGRPPRPDRADEVALSAGLARDLGAAPGDVLQLESMTHEWVTALFRGVDPGPADGPSTAVTVTAIARTAADFGRQASVVHLTPAFVDRHDGEIDRLDEIHVRVGPDALRRHRSQELTVLFGSPHQDSPFIDLGRTESLGNIADALRLVGLVGGVAGSLALALALARSTRRSTADRSALVALGWTRSDQLRALALVHAPPMAMGLTVGLLLGWRASPWAMVELARSIDPRPDAVLVDSKSAAVLVSGSVVAAAALLLVIPALVIRRRLPSRPARARFPIGRPLALSVGIRHGLMAPADRGGRTSRGAVVAVAGAVAVGAAALVVSASIDRLQHDASLTGERAERLVDGGNSMEAFDDAVARLVSDDRVAVVAGQHQGLVTVPGPGDVPVLVHEPLRGRAEPSITAGRMPRAADEVAIGPETVEATGADEGGEIQVSGEAGAARYRVVGIALFPEPDFAYDDGIVLTVDGAEPVIGDPHEIRGGVHQVFFEWADGVDVDRADRALAADGFAVQTVGTGVRARPVSVSNLGAMEQLPRQLAVLVGLLAGATLLHVSWTAMALRRRELMTLRSLGCTRGTTSWVSATQPLAIIALGVLIGTPVGVAVGRSAWRPIAEDAHLVVRPVLDLWWFGAAVGVVVLTGVAAAALAARWTSRLAPSAHLRTE